MPENELKIIRMIDAPREIVWKYWTVPEFFIRWWGPEGFTSPFSSMDVRPRGKYLSCMRSPDGDDYWSTGTYREVIVPEKLVLTDSFSDEHGNVVPGTHYGMSKGFPSELLVTVTLEAYDGKTRLTIRHSGIGGLNQTERSDMEQGWNQSFDKLAREVKKTLV